MTSIPALAECDLGDTIEGEFGVPVALKNPDGGLIDKTVDDRPLKGFVRHSYKDPRSGRGNSGTVTVNSPVVKLRLSSLAEVPASGAKWAVGISGDWYDLDPNQPVEVNKDKGTVKLFLAKMRVAE